MAQSNPKKKPIKRTTRPKKVVMGAELTTALPQVEIDALKRELEERLVLLTETNRQLKRKIFDLYTIFEISRNFNAVLKYQSLLDTFIFTCLGQVGALKGAIFLKRDGQSNRFYMIQGKGSGDFPAQDQSLSADSPLAGYFTKLNRPVLTYDLINDIAGPEEVSILEHFVPGITVPLIYQTRLIGVFALADKISGRDFTQDDLEFLSILGNQIAVAIENARLFEGERNATQQLRETQSQLIHTEKLAALGEMSAKVAHEVNNPLGIIKNYLLLIRRSAQKQAPDEVSKYSRIVEQEIDRIAGIIRQLLELHRPKPLTFESVDLKLLIEDILVMVERLLSSDRITVTIDFDPSTPAITGSPQNLRQVFLNLIINARDAMPEGGSLHIKGHPADETVVVEVCDTGPGIPAEIIPRIFDPFFTTKEPGKGTGLGLAVCYGVVKSHEGAISYRNTASGGCFEIRLPVVLKEKNYEPLA